MKILIVEDDKDLLLTLTDLFESEGHTVFGFEKAKGVLEKVFQHKPDCAFLDIKLPDGRGDKLAKEIKKSLSQHEMRIYLMSAGEELALATEESGADGYLKKPFAFKEILDIVN